jgi:hypothetical protein
VRKTVAILLLFIFLLAVPASAETDVQKNNVPEVLTLEYFYTKDINKTHQPTVMDQQIDSLWKQENDLMEASNGIQQQLDLLDSYKRLYEKREKGTTLTFEEQGEFLGYQYMFGLKPPEYNSEEMFNKFIKTRDLPHYSVWAAIQNLKINKDMLLSSVKIGVKQLFDGIIDIQDTLALQEELYGNMQKQNAQMLLKYKSGMVSEINKYISDVSLEKQRLSNEKLKRTLDNLKMSLKQQLGISLKQDIVLKPYDNEKGIKLLSDYPNYLDKALKNRMEIVTSKMDLQVKQREADIIKQYFPNELLSERLEADQALEDKTIAYKDAVNKVTADITSGFKDVQLKKSDFYIAVGKYQSSEKKNKDAELQYAKGLISLADFWNVQLAFTQAKLGYNKAMRDYNNALYKLDTACGIGPGYTTGMGGM